MAATISDGTTTLHFFDLLGMPPEGLQAVVIEEERPGADGSAFRLGGLKAKPSQVVALGFTPTAAKRQATFLALRQMKSKTITLVHQGIEYAPYVVREVPPPSSDYIRIAGAVVDTENTALTPFGFRCQFPLVIQYAGGS